MTYLCLERSERNGEKHERTYRVVTEQKITGIGINGSARKDGNTAILIKRVLKELNQEEENLCRTDCKL